MVSQLWGIGQGSSQDHTEKEKPAHDWCWQTDQAFGGAPWTPRVLG